MKLWGFKDGKDNVFNFLQFWNAELRALDVRLVRLSKLTISKLVQYAQTEFKLAYIPDKVFNFGKEIVFKFVLCWNPQYIPHCPISSSSGKETDSKSVEYVQKYDNAAFPI